MNSLTVELSDSVVALMHATLLSDNDRIINVTE